jgi:hypothetical protein
MFGGEEVMRPSGFKHTEVTKKKISEKNKGHIHSEKTKEKISLSKQGQKINKNQLNALILGRKKAYTKTAIKKRVNTRKIKNNYKHTSTSKNKISNTLKRKIKLREVVPFFKKGQIQQNTGRTHFKKGNHISFKTEFKKGQIAWNKEKFGENSHSWKGGLSFEPYGFEFNNYLKKVIRKRDNYECKICGKKQIIKNHAVHHIDYNKKNNNPKNLITLCNSCHTKTNFNRNNWIKYFRRILNK